MNKFNSPSQLFNLKNFLISISLISAFVTLSCRKGSSQQLTGTETKRINIEKREVGVQWGAQSTIAGRSPADGDKPSGHDPILEMGDAKLSNAIPMAMNILNLSDENGISPLALDSEFLMIRMQKIFGNMPRKDNEIIFTLEQNSRMGEAVPTNRKGIGYRFGRPESIEADALQVWREFFGDACSKKIDAEFSSPNQSNLLIKSTTETPNTATINSFMTLLFGYASPTGKPHNGAMEYAEAIADIRAKAPEQNKEEAIKNTTILACIHIGTDARTLYK